ncbi:hypothetical protein RRG08_064559 [Elysia crispata]|uniref:Uncharacterized protein n=1 Tax=Elysia crispata TaxID=231223 RepID=A0AAE1B9C7_9GAST|nr:hypothetical protein RRG08_064559 [Elysia crispata]
MYTDVSRGHPHDVAFPHFAYEKATPTGDDALVTSPFYSHGDRYIVHPLVNHKLQRAPTGFSQVTLPALRPTPNGQRVINNREGITCHHHCAGSPGVGSDDSVIKPRPSRSCMKEYNSSRLNMSQLQANFPSPCATRKSFRATRGYQRRTEVSRALKQVQPCPLAITPIALPESSRTSGPDCPDCLDWYGRDTL